MMGRVSHFVAVMALCLAASLVITTNSQKVTDIFVSSGGFETSCTCSKPVPLSSFNLVDCNLYMCQMCNEVGWYLKDLLADFFSQENMPTAWTKLMNDEVWLRSQRIFNKAYCSGFLRKTTFTRKTQENRKWQDLCQTKLAGILISAKHHLVQELASARKLYGASGVDNNPYCNELSCFHPPEFCEAITCCPPSNLVAKCLDTSQGGTWKANRCSVCEAAANIKYSLDEAEMKLKDELMTSDSDEEFSQAMEKRLESICKNKKTKDDCQDFVTELYGRAKHFSVLRKEGSIPYLNVFRRRQAYSAEGFHATTHVCEELGCCDTESYYPDVGSDETDSSANDNSGNDSSTNGNNSDQSTDSSVGSKHGL